MVWCYSNYICMDYQYKNGDIYFTRTFGLVISFLHMITNWFLWSMIYILGHIYFNQLPQQNISLLYLVIFTINYSTRNYKIVMSCNEKYQIVFIWSNAHGLLLIVFNIPANCNINTHSFIVFFQSMKN